MVITNGLNVIERAAGAPLTVAIDDDAANCGVIDYRGAAGGSIEIPLGASVAGINWLASDAADGTFRTAYAADGTTAVTQTVSADGSFIIPDTLYGKSFIKPVATTTIATENITVCLKT